jgi:VWFA-related protein
MLSSMMTTLSSRRLLLAAVIAGTGVAVARPAGQGARTIGGSDPVRLEFAAIGKDGKPVTDLKPEEVQLMMANKPRQVQTLRFVPIAAAATPKAASVPPPFGTNDQTGNGRSITLIVDHKSFRTGNEGDTRNAIIKLLDALPPSDRVSLITVPQGQDLVAPTTDRAVVKQALSQLQGLAVANESLENAACRSRDTLLSLEGAFNKMAQSDEPQIVAFFSSSMLGPRAAVTMSAGSNIGMCTLEPEAFTRVGAAAAAGHVRLYIYMHDITVSSTTSEVNTNIRGTNSPLVGLENLSGLTGAPIFSLATATETPLLKVLNETAGYYVARFEPEASERNGITRKIEVKVTRPDVTVRAASELMIPKPDSTPKPAPRDMAKETRVYRDLPLRVSGYVSKAPAAPAGAAPNAATAGKDVIVVCLVSPTEPNVKLSAVTLALIDPAGKGTQWSPTPEDVARGTTVMSSQLVAPGKYRLRAAAVDTTGRAGTADFDINADLVSAGESMKISGLMLGAKTGESFTPRFEFKSEPEATVYFEIYGKTSKPIGAMIDIAETPDGKAIAEATPQLSATSQPDKFLAIGSLPIANLAPGDYVIRATFAVQGEGEGKAMATLRKIK